MGFLDEPHSENSATRVEGADRWILLGFSILVFGLLLLSVLDDFQPVRLSAVGVLVFWLPLTALHEVGHALAARALGWSVCRIVIGFGRKVAGFKWLGMDVEFRFFPVSGYVLPAPRTMHLVRLKSTLIYLAGPMAELLVAVVLVWAVGVDVMLTATQNVGIIAAQAAVVAALVSVVLNLAPLSFATERGVAWSDGLGAVLSPFLPDLYFQTAMAAPYLLRAAPLIEKEDWQAAQACVDEALERLPDNVSLRCLQGALRAERGELRAAREVWQSFVEREGFDLLHKREQSELRRDLALVDLAIGADDLLEEASRHAEKALEASPRSVELDALRGSVLVARYRIHEGIDVLKQAMSRARDADEQNACATHLALAEFRRGNRSEAFRYLDVLRKRRYAGWFFRWVEGEMTSRRAPGVAEPQAEAPGPLPESGRE